MARVLGVNLTACTYNSITLLPDLLDFTFDVSADTYDTTVIGGGLWKTFIGGLKGGDAITLNMIYNNQSSASEGYKLWMTNLGATSQTFSFTDGTVTVSVSVIVDKVSLPVKVNDLIKETVGLKLTGAVTVS